MSRLAGNPSLYLRQHAAGPVDWWPWGAAALDHAEASGKPLFVSIGYAACHWCHVMAHESFDDPQTAELLNTHFVCIKVDREQHPEVDQVYQAALQLQGEGGGWPLSAFCFPDGTPFYVGTYFPKTPRFGKPPFVDVVHTIAQTFANDRDKLEENGQALREGMVDVDQFFRGAAGPTAAQLPSLPTVVAARDAIVQRCDAAHGGLAGRQKFPSLPVWMFLASATTLGGEGQAGANAAARQWLLALVNGGIYDHVGGGLARYATDEVWGVPHFEKMLSDQGLLLLALASATTLMPAPVWLPVIAQTIHFLQRELAAPGGGFFAALDADSGGEEGGYYLWTRLALDRALGPASAELVAATYGVTDAGHAKLGHGQAVLHRDLACADAPTAEMLQALTRLCAVREGRPRPAVDDTVLMGHNGLVLAGLARAARALAGSGADPAAAAAADAALALAHATASRLRAAIGDGGRLARYASASGELAHHQQGTIDDYAFVAWGLAELAVTTNDATLLREASELVIAAFAKFVEVVDNRVVAYLVAADPLLFHRPESVMDQATPAGSFVLMDLVCRLAVADERLATQAGLAERYLGERCSANPRGVNPLAQATLLCAIARQLCGKTVIVSAGDGHGELWQVALAQARRQPFIDALPGSTKPAVNGHAAAYVCGQGQCSSPVTSAQALVALLT